MIALLDDTTDGGSQNGVTSSNIDGSSANAYLALLSYYGTAIGAGDVTDSESNTYTALTNRTGDSGTMTRIFYCLNPTTSATLNFTATKSSTWPAVCFIAFSGVDSYEAESGNGGSGASIQPGSLTPANDGSLIINSFCHFSNKTYSVDSSLSEFASINYSNGNNMGGEYARLIQSTAAAINPTWSWAVSNAIAVAQAVFAPSAGRRTGALMGAMI